MAAPPVLPPPPPATAPRSGAGSGWAVAWTLWQRCTLRHWRLALPQYSLLVLLLALGVGVFLAIRLANRGALVSFQAFSESITGTTDWIVEPGAGVLPDTTLDELRAALGRRPVHLVPVLETTATWQPPGSTAAADSRFGEGGETWQLLGLDLIGILNLPVVGERPNRLLFQQQSEGAGTDDFWARWRDPRAVYVAEAAARARGWAVGQRLPVLLDDGAVELTIVGLLPEDPRTPTPERLLVMDLPALQVLAGRPGTLSRVEVLVEPGPQLDLRRDEARDLLQAAGRGRWTVEAPETRRATGERMTEAFRLNLTVLSLIALAVGVLLVLQALEAAVVRRRQETAILRSLGVEPRLLQTLWLAEALTLGVVGTGVGILLGWGGAQLAIGGVAATVNALYQTASASAAHPTPADLGWAVVLGLGASLVAGWLPAREAALVPPAQKLARGSLDEGLDLFRRPWLGLYPAVGAGLLAQLPGLPLAGGLFFPLAGYGAALLGLLAAVLLAGALVPVVGRLLGVALGGVGAGARWAASRLRRGAGRHKLAAAGVCLAGGMTAGMGLLIASFEATMANWIAATLRGDIYVAPAGAQSASSTHRVRAATWQTMATDPAVAVAVPVRVQPITLRGLPTYLVGSPLRDPLREFVWVSAPPAEAELVAGAGTVEPAFASESFARRFRVAPGAVLEVPTPVGPRPVVITAVFAEYGNERGSLLVDPATVGQWLGDDDASRLVFGLRPGTDAVAVRDRWATAYPALTVRDNANLRAEVLRIFRQTFGITYALQAIGLVVAIGGVAMALASLLYEARGDLTTLRQLGMARRDLAQACAVEGAGMAAAGLAAGLTLSAFLGWLLIFVINRQSFGWTLASAIPWGELVGFSLAVLAAAALVGALVGAWAAQLPAEREE